MARLIRATKFATSCIWKPVCSFRLQLCPPLEFTLTRAVALTTAYQQTPTPFRFSATGPVHAVHILPPPLKIVPRSPRSTSPKHTDQTCVLPPSKKPSIRNVTTTLLPRKEIPRTPDDGSQCVSLTEIATFLVGRRTQRQLPPNIPAHKPASVLARQ